MFDKIIDYRDKKTVTQVIVVNGIWYTRCLRILQCSFQNSRKSDNDDEWLYSEYMISYTLNSESWLDSHSDADINNKAH